MLEIRKMRHDDVETLYDIALRSFRRDYEKRGVYPPLINLKRRKFLPLIVFGKTILYDGEIIGGAFVARIFRKGELGAIFLNPSHQGKGYGRQAMQMIEASHPKAKTWKLVTPADSHGLHRFYESLGYVKAGEKEDAGSGIRGFIFRKTIE